jgi:hypothetical protein
VYFAQNVIRQLGFIDQKQNFIERFLISPVFVELIRMSGREDCAYCPVCNQETIAGMGDIIPIRFPCYGTGYHCDTIDTSDTNDTNDTNFIGSTPGSLTKWATYQKRPISW